MTDRIKGFTVVLKEDVRIDDAQEGIMKAIQHLNNVEAVIPVVSTLEDVFARERALNEISRAMWDLLGKMRGWKTK